MSLRGVGTTALVALVVVVAYEKFAKSGRMRVGA